jgi:hypothetical protein
MYDEGLAEQPVLGRGGDKRKDNNVQKTGLLRLQISLLARSTCVTTNGW